FFAIRRPCYTGQILVPVRQPPRLASPHRDKVEISQTVRTEPNKSQGLTVWGNLKSPVILAHGRGGNPAAAQGLQIYLEDCIWLATFQVIKNQNRLAVRRPPCE